MTIDLTLRLSLPIPGGTITVDTDDPAALAHPLVADVLARVTGLDPVAPLAPAVVTDEDREYLRSPDRIKNQTPAKKAAAKAGKATGPKSGPHAAGQFAAPGTKLRSILDVLADHGGRWEGTAVTLGTEAGATPGSAAKSIRVLAAAGLVTTEKAHPRQITAIALTGAGWRHLDRPKPSDGPLPRLVLTEPTPAADDDRPPAIDLATLPREGRKPFDPDAARAAAAGAL